MAVKSTTDAPYQYTWTLWEVPGKVSTSNSRLRMESGYELLSGSLPASRERPAGDAFSAEFACTVDAASA